MDNHTKTLGLDSQYGELRHDLTWATPNSSRVGTLMIDSAASREFRTRNRLMDAAMPEELVPILHVKDARESAKWYTRLGFVVEDEHRFAPGLPLYLFLRRGPNALHLSEHMGDARPDTLLYFYVDHVNSISAEFGAEVRNQPWAREVQLRDPDGNRWRIGERRP